MSKKPQKRLVHKHQYLGMLLEKGGLYSFAVAFGGGACGCLLIAAVLLFMVPSSWSNRSDWDEPSFLLLLLIGGFFGLLCVGFLWLAMTLIKAARQMAPVAPVTRQNIGLLPEVETLVRSSDRPALEPQAELLRSALSDTQTPPEQLLRATHSG